MDSDALPAESDRLGDPVVTTPLELADDDVDTVLTQGTLEVVGRLTSASNASFLATATLDGIALACVYKPVAGERPLWDFPDGNLAGREYAARLVSRAGGFDVVPSTVLRDGRFGPGMCQRWVETHDDHALVDVVSTDFEEPGWLPVVEAEDQFGRPVLLVHADDDRLRDMAVFDTLINNADRKAGHVLLAASPDEAGQPMPGGAASAGDPADVDADEHKGSFPGQLRDGRLWGCDHGVSLHHEDKLRTILWGWAGEPLRQPDLARVDTLVDALDGDLPDALRPHLTRTEIDALLARALVLRATAVMPVPGGRWPMIPWPPI